MYSALDNGCGDRRPPPDRLKIRNTKRYPAGDPLPNDPVGQKLNELFPNGWDWIYSAAPDLKGSPDWETVKHYPLTPQQLWEYHQDPESLVGTRPKAETRWIVLDIDKNSPHHPSQDLFGLNRICEALETIGICRVQFNQSSYSGGIHIYCPLPQPVSSFWLATTVKFALESIAVPLKSGHCEIFPNPKRYKPRGKGFSNYAALRLPMQPESGFLPLDEDLAPLSWSLDIWLEQFECLSEQQDLLLLNQAIADAKIAFKLRKRREPKSIENWQDSIAQEKAEGWTGPGQTNEKLKTFACEARVFLGLENVDDIADHIYDCSVNSPGFHEYSKHVREIRRRSMEMATWAYDYYWPYGTNPSRSTTYKAEGKLIDFQYHQALKEKSQQKIQEALARLETEGYLASGISDRANQLVFEAKVSRKTLYKTHNLEFWHPKFIKERGSDGAPSNDSTTAETQAQTESLQPQTKSLGENKIKSLQPLLNKESFQSPIYEGFVDHQKLNSAPDALPPQGQRAAKGARDFSTPTSSPQISNWDELKASLPLRLQNKISQRQRNLSSSAESVSPSQKPFGPVSSSEQTTLAFSREPLPSEVSEFEEWYALAIEFGVCTDSQWQLNQYLVCSDGEWMPYFELSSVFTVKKLKAFLKE